MLLADSHCHILDPRLAERASDIATRLNGDGLAFVVEISASTQESPQSLAFANTHDNVYCTLGVHPHMVHLYTDEFERWALTQRSKKIVAIGECGLDYFHMPHPKELQRDIFVRQIKLADKMKLPLVIHTRDAFEDMLQTLVENGRHLNNGILFHCFSEGAEQVELVLKHFDAYFAFGGAVTYKNNKISDGAIAAVPLDRILVETDAPYLAPEAIGGRKVLNEPKHVYHVAAHISKVRALPLEQVAAATLANTKRFFRIL